ncbi:MAG TPA: response regulator [Steroidobacteraceae bacterium]|nr:response regulator [Steroidobacteraceae bacterium]
MSERGLVHVVDDDASFRTAIRRMLTAAGFEVRAFASGAELLARASPDEHGCVLADLQLPELSGLELQQELGRAGVALPFVFLTGHGDVPSAVCAMRQGAVDFLDKCAPQDALIAAIERALQREAAERGARARQERLSRRFAVLTAREWEVLRQVVKGRMNKQISADLGIHERTVKLHRTAITTKLGVRSVAELTSLAREAGVLG